MQGFGLGFIVGMVCAGGVAIIVLGLCAAADDSDRRSGYK